MVGSPLSLSPAASAAKWSYFAEMGPGSASVPGLGTGPAVVLWTTTMEQQQQEEEEEEEEESPEDRELLVETFVGRGKVLCYSMPTSCLSDTNTRHVYSTFLLDITERSSPHADHEWS